MWPAPEPGDILWCRFPERPRDKPGPKPRSALVLAVAQHEDGVIVSVAYGTSQALSKMHAGEFAIRREEAPSAFALAGLSYDTKFDLRQIVDLPWNDVFFEVPPAAPHGQSPKLGTLHPSMIHAAKSAAKAVEKAARHSTRQ